MRTQWVGAIWAAAAAALLGVFVAAAMNGGAPSAWPPLLLIALPTAFTLMTRIVSRARRRHPASSRYRIPPSERIKVTNSGPSHKPITGEDRDVVSEIVRWLGPRQLDWLRSADFVTPWLDSNARPALDLAPLVTAVVDAPFDDEIRHGLGALGRATDAFADYYEHNTYPDPLLLGEDWRFFEWDEAGVAETAGEGDELWAGRPIQLRGLAGELVIAYEGFCVVAGRLPNAEKRTKARAR